MKHLTCFCAIVLCTFCFSQQEKLDSLRNDIETLKKQDSTYINTRLNYSKQLFYHSPNDSTLLDFSLETLKLTRLINYNKGEALVYNRIGVIYQYIYSDSNKAIENYQNSLRIIEKYKLPEKYIAGNIGNIASIYYEQKEYRKALSYYKKLLN